MLGLDSFKKQVLDLLEASKKSCQMAVSLLIVMWTFSILDLMTGARFSSHGIHPREFPMGYLSMLWAFFMHHNMAELFANTFPFLVLSSILLVRSPTEYIFLTTVHILTAGTLIWALGPERSNFVGASSLIFAYFSYLVSIGCIERDIVSVTVSVLTLFLYGSLAFTMLLPAATSPYIINVLGFCIGATFAVAHSKYLKNLGDCTKKSPDEENSGLLGKESAYNDDEEAQWASKYS